MSEMWDYIYHMRPQAREAIIAKATAGMSPAEALRAQVALRTGSRAPKAEALRAA